MSQARPQRVCRAREGQGRVADAAGERGHRERSPRDGAIAVCLDELAAVDGENILIRDNPKEFADAILAVLQDRDLAHRLGAGGRATVERHYSWDVIGTDLVLSANTRRGAFELNIERRGKSLSGNWMLGNKQGSLKGEVT